MMNAEELGYYLFMEKEELKRKEQREGLTDDEKVNLETNPLYERERATQNR